MRWLAVILIMMPLAGCIGENEEVAIAKCTTDVIKLRGGQLVSPAHPYTEDEYGFVATCRQSYGYRFNPSKSVGAKMSKVCRPPDGAGYFTIYTLVAGCYEPISLENKLRAWVER
jgi:hypothetical protein